MNHRKIKYIILTIILLLAVFLGWSILFSNEDTLAVTFFDVGQGDSILIQKGDQEILVDGGRNGKILLEKLGGTMPFWDRKIEAVVVTHPDVDHIGGLVDVLRNYEIGALVQTDAQSESKAFETLQAEVKDKNIQTIEGRSGVQLRLDDGILGEVIFPFTDSANSSTNENSIVIDFRYHDESFLLTGDLPSEQEEKIMEKYPKLKTTVLKAAHHGSKYSTSDKFLDFLKAETAVVSVGKNSYGHPNPETLSRLKSHTVAALRTDEKGDIVFGCMEIGAGDGECQVQTSR